MTNKFLTRWLLISVVIMMALPMGYLHARDFTPYFTVPHHQAYLKYLITSGKLTLPHPVHQPWQAGQLLDSLSAQKQGENHWDRLMLRDLRKLMPPAEENHSGSGKLVLDGSASYAYEGVSGQNKGYYALEGGVTYLWKNLGMRYQFTLDERYKTDTVYFGTTGKLESEVFGRSNEAYFVWQARNIRLFAGRMDRNFGLPGEPGLLLSDHPFSYDHFALTFSNRLLQYTTLFTRLEDHFGFDIRDEEPLYSWSRRFLNVHRFEVSVTPKLEIIFTESMLMGGKDLSPQAQYLNPANLFYVSKMSDRKGYLEKSANAMMQLELYYRPLDKVGLYGSFLLDDMDFTKRLRELYPDRIGITAKAILSDLVPYSQLSLTYNRISNWTYTSFYTWGNHTFYGKSLGFPWHGYENLKADMELFSLEPFILKATLSASRMRVQELQSAFIAEKTKFPVGVAQNNYHAGLNLTWFPATWVYAGADIAYNRYENFGHTAGEEVSYVDFQLFLKINGIFELFNWQKSD